MSVSEILMEQAEEIAKQSPCTRRKYGVIIAQGPIVWVSAYNERVGRCCDGNICIRDLNNAPQNRGIEVGAELHAEAVALLRFGMKLPNLQFYLAGFDAKGSPLRNPVPCHYCTMMMAFCGYNHYITRNEHGLVVYKSTWEAMEEHESTYRGYVV